MLLKRCLKLFILALTVLITGLFVCMLNIQRSSVYADAAPVYTDIINDNWKIIEGETIYPQFVTATNPSAELSANAQLFRFLPNAPEPEKVISAKSAYKMKIDFGNEPWDTDGYFYISLGSISFRVNAALEYKMYYLEGNYDNADFRLAQGTLQQNLVGSGAVEVSFYAATAGYIELNVGKTQIIAQSKNPVAYYMTELEQYTKIENKTGRNINISTTDDPFKDLTPTYADMLDEIWRLHDGSNLLDRIVTEDNYKGSLPNGISAYRMTAAGGLITTAPGAYIMSVNFGDNAWKDDGYFYMSSGIVSFRINKDLTYRIYLHSSNYDNASVRLAEGKLSSPLSGWVNMGFAVNDKGYILITVNGQIIKGYVENIDYYFSLQQYSLVMNNTGNTITLSSLKPATYIVEFNNWYASLNSNNYSTENWNRITDIKMTLSGDITDFGEMKKIIAIAKSVPKIDYYSDIIDDEWKIQASFGGAEVIKPALVSNTIPYSVLPSGEKAYRYVANAPEYNISGKSAYKMKIDFGNETWDADGYFYMSLGSISFRVNNKMQYKLFYLESNYDNEGLCIAKGTLSQQLVGLGPVEVTFYATAEGYIELNIGKTLIIAQSKDPVAYYMTELKQSSLLENQTGCNITVYTMKDIADPWNYSISANDMYNDIWKTLLGQRFLTPANFNGATFASDSNASLVRYNKEGTLYKCISGADGYKFYADFGSSEWDDKGFLFMSLGIINFRLYKDLTYSMYLGGPNCLREKMAFWVAWGKLSPFSGKQLIEFSISENGYVILKIGSQSIKGWIDKPYFAMEQYHTIANQTGTDVVFSTTLTMDDPFKDMTPDYADMLDEKWRLHDGSNLLDRIVTEDDYKGSLPNGISAYRMTADGNLIVTAPGAYNLSVNFGDSAWKDGGYFYMASGIVSFRINKDLTYRIYLHSSNYDNASVRLADGKLSSTLSGWVKMGFAVNDKGYILITVNGQIIKGYVENIDYYFSLQQYSLVMNNTGNTITLSSLKPAAYIAEFKNWFDSLKSNDYSTENWKIIENYFNNATVSSEKTNNYNEIKNITAETKNNIGNIYTIAQESELAEEKTAATDAVNNYNDQDYYQSRLDIVVNIATEYRSKITAAKTFEDVKTLKNEALNKISLIYTKTDDDKLTNMKADYKSNLAAYVNENDYTAPQWSEILSIINSRSGEIDSADTFEDAETASIAGKADIDAVTTKSADKDATLLVQQKKDAVGELESYAVEANYSKGNWELVLGIISDYKEQINDSESKTEIDELIAKVKSEIDEIEKTSNNGCSADVLSMMNIEVTALFVSAIWLFFRKKRDYFFIKHSTKENSHFEKTNI